MRGKFLQGSKIKKSHHFIFIALLVLLCLYSTLINYIPHDYIVATGDKHIPVDIKHNFSRYLYVWGHFGGSGYVTPGNSADLLHNGFFYVLDILGIEDHQKQNIKYFLFLFLSGLSFYIALLVFFKDKFFWPVYIIVSLFYSFNHFTLDAIETIGAYGNYFDLYIFLPLIWVFFTQGIVEDNKRYFMISFLLFFLSVGGLSHPAFLIILFLLLGATLFFCFLTKRISRKYFLKILPIFLIYILIISFYFLPYLYFFFSKSLLIQKSQPGNHFLFQWIKGQSTLLSDLFRLAREHTLYPYNYPYNYFQHFVLGIAYYPYILLILSFFFFKTLSYKQKSWFLFFIFLTLVFIFGNAKAEISSRLSVFIFTLPFFSILRSADKFILFFPFLISFLLVYCVQGFLEKFQNGRLRKVIYFVLIVVIFSYPLPFFMGGFQTRLPRWWNNQWSNIVKMPHYYKKVAEYINNDLQYFKVLSMPFSGQVGIGWILYPKWKYIGVDFTTLYIHRPVLSSAYVPLQYIFSDYFDRHPDDFKKFFIRTLQSRGIKYIIFNKDVYKEYQEPLSSIIQNDLSSDLSLVKIFDGIELYRINSKKEWPLFYAVKKDYKPSVSQFDCSETQRNCIEDTFQKRMNNIVKSEDLLFQPKVSFRYLSPVKYEVRIQDASEPFWLVFSDSFHKDWKIYLDHNSKGFTFSDLRYFFQEPVDSAHKIINNYANAWYIEPQKTGYQKNFKLIVYFLPQNIFYMGLIISGIFLFAILLYLAVDYITMIVSGLKN